MMDFAKEHVCKRVMPKIELGGGMKRRGNFDEFFL
jgi:hypothetical protein